MILCLSLLGDKIGPYKQFGSGVLKRRFLRMPKYAHAKSKAGAQECKEDGAELDQRVRKQIFELVSNCRLLRSCRGCASSQKGMLWASASWEIRREQYWSGSRLCLQKSDMMMPLWPFPDPPLETLECRFKRQPPSRL
jgi:hypothetical protein